MVAALDWIRVNHADTDVVNASLGTGTLFSGSCDASTSFTIAMATAVDSLVTNGTMVFASSGNQGSATQVAAPACLQNAFAVGAVWDAPGGAITFLGCNETSRSADQPTCFTNSNATVDLYAPGALVTASGRDGVISTFGGTSQATPLTAGCAASILATNETLRPADLKAMLLASPTQVTDAKNGLAFPRLNCADAAQRAGMFTNGFER